MVQLDGSHHDWFEGRCAKCVLMVMVDDASSRVLARFYPAETTGAAFDVFGRWAKRYGVPRSVYADRHSIYRDEDHPEKPTQFGRAMRELSVELIAAYSPQAKGRVERMNATLQDRLVKEMRLRGIDSVERGNAFLEAKFLDELNERYAVKARRDQDLHRTVEAAAGAGTSLGEVLCPSEQRVVGNDWCVRWRSRWLQVDARHAGLCLPGRKVTVKERGDGALVLLRGEERLTFAELRTRPPTVTPKKAAVVNNVRYKPAAAHPWRNETARRRVAEPARDASLRLRLREASTLEGKPGDTST